MFIGDSLSSEPGGFTWNGKLDKEYNLGATHVYKIGQTTSWMAANALPIINKAPYGTFKKVIIWGGTNDAFKNDTSSTISNLKAISNAVKKKGGQLFVFLGYDAAKVMVGTTKNGTDYTQGTARESKLRTIELFDAIADGIGQAIIIPRVPGAKPEWAPNDGVHVHGSAHGAIASHIWNWPGVKP
jgi:lysophospholipase L1-like esterase